MNSSSPPAWNIASEVKSCLEWTIEIYQKVCCTHRIAIRHGTELEQVVHAYQRLCRSDWRKGFGSV